MVPLIYICVENFCTYKCDVLQSLYFKIICKIPFHNTIQENKINLGYQYQSLDFDFVDTGNILIQCGSEI